MSLVYFYVISSYLWNEMFMCSLLLMKILWICKICKRRYWRRITFWSCTSVWMPELWSQTVSTIYLGKASWAGMACLWRMMRMRPGGTVSKLVGISRKFHCILTNNWYLRFKEIKLESPWKRDNTFTMQTYSGSKFYSPKNIFKMK